MGLPLLLPDACWGVRRTCCCVISAGLVTLGRKKGLRTLFWLVASAFVSLGGHDWLDLDTASLCLTRFAYDSPTSHRSKTLRIMRVGALVLLAGAAAALQPTLRVHAAARPIRTSGSPVQKNNPRNRRSMAKRF